LVQLENLLNFFQKPDQANSDYHEDLHGTMVLVILLCANLHRCTHQRYHLHRPAHKRSVPIFIVAPASMFIIIVAPVTCPSSLSRQSRTHLHCCACQCARLHCCACCIPIFIVAPVACSSSLSRPLHAHLLCCAIECSRFIALSCAQPHCVFVPSETLVWIVLTLIAIISTF
jgi:hypothetical protein